MSEPNYNETVIIPFLQRKAQELMSTNLILEAHLLVEQNKIKLVEDKIKNIENDFNLKFSRLEEEKKELQKLLNQATQVKNTEVQLQSKIEQLTRLSSEQANTISNNRNSMREQQVIIEEMKTQLNNLNSQLEQSKVKSSSKKKKKEENILDGDSY